MEDRYNQPLEIDLEVIRKKAAQIMGIPVSELPIAKAAAAAEALVAQNPPPVHETPEEVKEPEKESTDSIAAAGDAAEDENRVLKPDKDGHFQ